MEQDDEGGYDWDPYGPSPEALEEEDERKKLLRMAVRSRGRGARGRGRGLGAGGPAPLKSSKFGVALPILEGEKGELQMRPGLKDFDLETRVDLANFFKRTKTLFESKPCEDKKRSAAACDEEEKIGPDEDGPRDPAQIISALKQATTQFSLFADEPNGTISFLCEEVYGMGRGAQLIEYNNWSELIDESHEFHNHFQRGAGWFPMSELRKRDLFNTKQLTLLREYDIFKQSPMILVYQGNAFERKSAAAANQMSSHVRILMRPYKPEIDEYGKIAAIRRAMYVCSLPGCKAAKGFESKHEMHFRLERRCRGCRAYFYCTEAHEKSDRNRHVLSGECKPFKEATQMRMKKFNASYNARKTQEEFFRRWGENVIDQQKVDQLEIKTLEQQEEEMKDVDLSADMGQLAEDMVFRDSERVMKSELEAKLKAKAERTVEKEEKKTRKARRKTDNRKKNKKKGDDMQVSGGDNDDDDDDEKEEKPDEKVAKENKTQPNKKPSDAAKLKKENKDEKEEEEEEEEDTDYVVGEDMLSLPDGSQIKVEIWIDRDKGAATEDRMLVPYPSTLEILVQPEQDPNGERKKKLVAMMGKGVNPVKVKNHPAKPDEKKIFLADAKTLEEVRDNVVSQFMYKQSKDDKKWHCLDVSARERAMEILKVLIEAVSRKPSQLSSSFVKIYPVKGGSVAAAAAIAPPPIAAAAAAEPFVMEEKKEQETLAMDMAAEEEEAKVADPVKTKSKTEQTRKRKKKKRAEAMIIKEVKYVPVERPDFSLQLATPPPPGQVVARRATISAMLKTGVFSNVQL
jgi:hypothetical protein